MASPSCKAKPARTFWMFSGIAACSDDRWGSLWQHQIPHPAALQTCGAPQAAAPRRPVAMGSLPEVCSVKWSQYWTVLSTKCWPGDGGLYRDSTAQPSAAMLAVTCMDECMSDNSRRPLDHQDKSRSQAKEENKKNITVYKQMVSRRTQTHTHTMGSQFYDATISVSSASRLKYRTLL